MFSRFELSCAIALVVAFAHLGTPASAQDTIKIGELNSYKGQPAFLEPYKRGWEMAVDEINAAGGVKVAGKSYTIEPEVVDPASDWPLFAEKAKEACCAPGCCSN